MNVTLDQAIEMHAKALKHRNGLQAPHRAKENARRCVASGDFEGQDVWLRVAASADKLLKAEIEERRHDNR